jgi:5'-3' exonuclease
MGIPFYFSYLIQNHKKIITKIENIKNINNLFIDSNSIIYDSLNFQNFKNKTQFENYIIENVIDKLQIIIKNINPRNKTFIAFDGVPPIAKLTQQKNRRYKSHYQAKLFNKTILWDTCAITPGTNFMNNLNNAIKKHFTNNENIILSLTDIPGEGEHKIFEYIRENINSEDCENVNNIVYGMDADLIMLSLNHLKYSKQIYLYRETPHFIKSLDNSLDPKQTYLINILELGNQIYKELTDDISVQKDTPDWLKEASDVLDSSLNNLQINGQTFYSKIDDYIFICFLLGNDFMPHFPAINIRSNGFTVLLELYKKLFNNKKQLIKDDKIVWGNFKLFIGKIAENEEMFLKEIYNLREKQSKKNYRENSDEEKEFKFNAMPSWERNIEIFINPFEEGWQHRYYYSLFDIDITKDNQDNKTIGNICTNYLQTLQWTYYYYSKECVNWNHSYIYHYPPLLSDLYKSVPYFDSELVLKEDKNIIHPHLLLSYVLPRNSLNLLPSNIHNYLLKNYENHYKEDYEFIYAFCKYFYEGHVKFPKLDFKEFSANINKIIV